MNIKEIIDQVLKGNHLNEQEIRFALGLLKTVRKDLIKRLKTEDPCYQLTKKLKL